MADGEIGSEQFTDEDRLYAGSRFRDVVDALFIHFTHPTWRQNRNDPGTATRVNGMKVR